MMHTWLMYTSDFLDLRCESVTFLVIVLTVRVRADSKLIFQQKLQLLLAFSLSNKHLINLVSAKLIALQ